ncbi:hypothetical protein SAMD00019534_088050, partial [Acytostelium subglobosum LB1]|uniref:hypothetical protein n=1 Tax=Acytostelium subglobosum LB1 TaxID=1410327 RepID=UPI00064497D5
SKLYLYYNNYNNNNMSTLKRKQTTTSSVAGNIESFVTKTSSSSVDEQTKKKIKSNITPTTTTTTTTTTTNKSTPTPTMGNGRKKMTTSTLEESCNTFKEDWPQWRKDLYNNGWAVVRNVVPPERCETYRAAFWKWFEDFGTGIDRNDRASWSSDKWPANLHGILQQYAFGQNQFVWDIRSEQAIIDVFSQIYNTDELLVSFDGGNLSRPGKSLGKPWYHLDQGNTKLGFRCVQGFLNLMDCQQNDGGLIVYDKSHIQHANFYKGEGVESQGDWYKFPEDPRELKYFKDCKEIKVCCNVGDVVLWDSRTIHWAATPTGGNCRMVVYTSYQPASLITKTDLAKKQKAFNQKRMTSHWAAENIKLFSKTPRTYGNQDLIDNFKYDEKTLPTLNDRARQLAGLDPYD